jgi:hypothetical protein
MRGGLFPSTLDLNQSAAIIKTPTVKPNVRKDIHAEQGRFFDGYAKWMYVDFRADHGQRPGRGEMYWATSPKPAFEKHTCRNSW